MARGYEGAFGRKLNAPYVWIPLCLLFLAPFVDLRRPFRLLHLDLLVLLSFGVSHVFFNRGEIGAVGAARLSGAALPAGANADRRLSRRASGPGRSCLHVPLAALAVLLVFVAAFRIGLNVADSNVIDVGYAGVIGADRIVDGDELYGEGFSADVEHGDTYGPVNYLLYVPFEQALRWSGGWDDLPAAHAAAIAFDLLVIGWPVPARPAAASGPRGPALGLALAYAWATYPYTSFALQTNSNDTLIALRVSWPRCSRSGARPPSVGSARGARRGHGGGGEVRDRWRWRRCSRAGPRSLFAGVLALDPGRGRAALLARRGRARALRPHDRLPGRRALAVQHLGAGGRARLASDAS